MRKWAWRGAGLSGGLIPVIGDALVLAGSKVVSNPGKTHLLQGAKGSMGLGAGIALVQYNQRWGLSNMAARNLQMFSLGAYQAPSSAWESSPSKSWQQRGVGVTASTGRSGAFKSRGRSSASPSGRSPSATRSPFRSGKSRNRCRTRYRGKRCRLPANHSGRHSYS